MINLAILINKMTECILEERRPQTGVARAGPPLDSLGRLFQQIYKSITAMLEQTDQISTRLDSPFHLKKPPTISVELYLARLAKLAKCDPSAFVVALVLLDRFQVRNPGFIVNGKCIHRLLITSLLLAIKGHSDVLYNNKYYAQVGGIPLQELNLMEATMLEMVEFEVVVSAGEYGAFLERLIP
jgi:hypothetical protein